MATLDDVDELLRAHTKLLPGGRGAPRIENGARVGASLLRAATALISAAIQTAAENTFRAALPLSFDHLSPDQQGRYWQDCKGWGNPNPENIRRLFFRIGFPDVLDGLRWQNCNNEKVVSTLDRINQVRNRVAYGQPLTVNGQPFRLTKPIVCNWYNYATVFVEKFQPFVVGQYK
jgi:hypothetical protein